MLCRTLPLRSTLRLTMTLIQRTSSPLRTKVLMRKKRTQRKLLLVTNPRKTRLRRFESGQSLTAGELPNDHLHTARSIDKLVKKLILKEKGQSTAPSKKGRRTQRNKVKRLKNKKSKQKLQTELCCPLCPHRVESRDSYIKHLLYVHGRQTINPKLQKCNICHLHCR